MRPSLALRVLVNTLALALSGAAEAASVTYPSSDLVKVVCKKPENLKNANPEYVQSLTEALKAAGARTVTCTECYRSVEDQRQACRNVCGNPNGCPNDTCAPPGYSQHQKPTVAVCDLTGLPPPPAGCQVLRKLCMEKYGGKCGIGGYGGYGGGAYHFGVNDSCFSIWNQCASLERPPNSRCTFSGAAGPNGPSGPVDPNAPGDDPPDPAHGMLDTHKVVILAAIALAGAGAFLALKQYRKSHP